MNYVEEWLETLRKLETCKFLGFDGCRVDKLLTIPTKEVVIGEAPRLSKTTVLRAIVTTAFSDGYYYDFGKIKDAKCVLFYSHLHAARKDYTLFMEKIASCSNEAVLFTGVGKKGMHKIIHIGWRSWTVLMLCVLWENELKKANIDKKYHSIFLIDLVQMYRWKHILERNEKIITTIQSMVSIFDAREFENVFAQFCNHHNIVTGTLQHGHFGNRLFVNKYNYCIDIPYKGFVSDYFLAWGQYSKNCAIESGISTAQVFLCGCPEFISEKESPVQGDAVGVLLDGDILSGEDNVKMLEIAQQDAARSDKKLIIKLHPKDNINKYQGHFDTDKAEVFIGSIEEFAQRLSYVICCNTSALIQMMAYKVKVYHYRTTTCYDMYKVLQNYSFTDFEGLLRIKASEDEYDDCLEQLSITNNVRNLYKTTLEGLGALQKYTY